jgi:hypothetical protein
VPENVALRQEWSEQVVEMKVRAADGRGCHTDDGVRGFLDRRIRDILYADCACRLPSECSHASTVSDTSPPGQGVDSVRLKQRAVPRPSRGIRRSFRSLSRVELLVIDPLGLLEQPL